MKNKFLLYLLVILFIGCSIKSSKQPPQNTTSALDSIVTLNDESVIDNDWIYGYWECEMPPFGVYGVSFLPNGIMQDNIEYGVYEIKESQIWVHLGDGYGTSFPLDRGSKLIAATGENNIYIWMHKDPNDPLNKGNVKTKVSGTYETHEYVDLGLSVKWATYNYGASNQNFIGDAVKYVSSCDWNGSWRLPTIKEWEELKDTNNCHWEYINNYRVSGIPGTLITSKKKGFEGNAIFLPYQQEFGTYHNYWSSTPDKHFEGRMCGITYSGMIDSYSLEAKNLARFVFK